MRYKYIIFDRDGTLNKTAENAGGYVLSEDEMILLPNVKASLSALCKEGVRCFVFTQQSCIGKGLLTEARLEKIHTKMQKDIGKLSPIESFYHCPHVISDNCMCRKPKPGMLTECLEDYNLPKNEVLVVGDAFRDYQSAIAAGLDFAFVKSSKHSDEEYEETGVDAFDGLAELVEAYYGIDVMQMTKEHSVYGLSLFIILLEIIGLFTYALTYQYF